MRVCYGSALVPLLVCALHCSFFGGRSMSHGGTHRARGEGHGHGQAKKSTYTQQRKKAALSLRGMARMANALVGERKKKSCKKGPCPGLSGPGQGQQPQVRTPMYCGIYLQQRGRMQELGSSCEKARVAEWPNDEPSELDWGLTNGLPKRGERAHLAGTIHPTNTQQNTPFCENGPLSCPCQPALCLHLPALRACPGPRFLSAVLLPQTTRQGKRQPPILVLSAVTAAIGHKAGTVHKQRVVLSLITAHIHPTSSYPWMCL